MSEQAASGGSSAHEAGTVTQSDKGKNKATDSTADVNMDDDESSSGESDEEDQVSLHIRYSVMHRPNMVL